MYRRLARPLLFRLDAERAHHLTLGAAGLAGRVPGLIGLLDRTLHRPQPSLTQTLWGQRFRSPVGLAAGLDKDAVAAPLLGALGFGFLEVGTVTPLGQPGNPAPRLFRLAHDGALINRMGFNNRGAQELAARLGRLPASPRRVPLWVNIGKNRDTPLEEAAADYLACLRRLAGVADGFVLNVSSPNTPGLRSLQAADELGRLAERLSAELHALRPGLPLLVKLSPDLEDADFDASVDAATHAGASGLVISNTTLGREGLTHPFRRETGGLSGRPLTARSRALVGRAYRLSGGRLPIVGVGGVFTPQDAYALIRAGASLVEVYTSFVYEGPGLPSRLHAGLARLLRQDGFRHVSEAVGVDA